MFKSIKNRKLKIQITVYIFVVNIDTESHGYVVCISCVCMVVCRGKKQLLIFQIVCTLVVLMMYSFDGYMFNQATVQDSLTSLHILLLCVM
jgi:hypothetical protein